MGRDDQLFILNIQYLYIFFGRRLGGGGVGARGALRLLARVACATPHLFTCLFH